MFGGVDVRLRDLPGLVAKADKLIEQLREYGARWRKRLPGRLKKKRPGFHP